MDAEQRMQTDLLHIEDAIWVLVRPIGRPTYDFAFDKFLACRRPWRRPESVRAIARVGAVDRHAELAAICAEHGIEPLHDEAQHLRASELPHWYPRIADLTPTSLWGGSAPSVDEIDATLGWPVFVKGARQTSRHRASLHIAATPEAYHELMEVWRHDPILHWQTVVCRKFLHLRRIAGDSGERVPPSFELRTFFWRGQLAGIGRYWWDAPPYRVEPKEEADAIAVATEAARRLDLPFVVIDVGQDVDRRWWVIECNDAQEAGYAGISPFALWQRIVEIEREEVAERP